MSSSASTKCGADPGPQCIGCGANGHCGTSDDYSLSYPANIANEDEGGY